MSLDGRIRKLEKQSRSKNGDPGLWDNLGREVEAVIVKMPTEDDEGLARLPDGVEKTVAKRNTGLDYVIIHTHTKDGITYSDSPDALYYGTRLLNIDHGYV